LIVRRAVTVGRDHPADRGRSPAACHAANVAGMRRAVAQLSAPPGYVLTDVSRCPGWPSRPWPCPRATRQRPVSPRPSVLAKVTRDRIMVELDRGWPWYGFAEHKGYATPAHDEALTAHGPCQEHRFSFVQRRSCPCRSLPGCCGPHSEATVRGLLTKETMLLTADRARSTPRHARGAVTLVLGEPVPRPTAVQLDHDPVLVTLASTEAAATQAAAWSPLARPGRLGQPGTGKPSVSTYPGGALSWATAGACRPHSPRARRGDRPRSAG